MMLTKPAIGGAGYHK
jgi:hypothetical protein